MSPDKSVMSDTSFDHVNLNELMAKEISHGVSRTLSDVFGVKTEMGAYRLETERSPLADISGFVELNNQEKHGGALIVTFPQSTIFAILGKFYRKQFTEYERSVKDGVGELTNMIFGLMKANLGKNGFAFKMALPNVVIGSQTSDGRLTPPMEVRKVVLTIPYETEAGPFSVTLILYPIDSAA